VRGHLGDDIAANEARLRKALREAAAGLVAADPVSDLKNRLLQLAVDADIVLDLHCDSEATMHLYALTPQADVAVELGALLQARAILLATESGDQPFDEACSRPWLELRRLPLGGATDETRSDATRQQPCFEQLVDRPVQHREGHVAPQGRWKPLPQSAQPFTLHERHRPTDHAFAPQGL
jgi:hypothetical protein